MYIHGARGVGEVVVVGRETGQLKDRHDIEDKRESSE